MIGNDTLFTGRRYDPETGLYYYRTRYLDPVAGRFTIRGTIGTWGDQANVGNGYTYVGNNPYSFGDAFGRSAPPLPYHWNSDTGPQVQVATPDWTFPYVEPGGPIAAMEIARSYRE
jgi:RHS repeat-associated protein